MIRSLAGVQRTVSYNRLRAIIVRADADQVALTGWLLNALAKPPIEEAPALKPPFNSLVTRMFYLKHGVAPQQLQEAATLIRAKANLERVATCGSQTIAARGTFEQIAAAERVAREMDVIIAP